MKQKRGIFLLTALMMFPQIVETIYSPALTHIAKGFQISAEQAAQTLSFYFFAFALGIVFWGRMCDKIGRRPTILAGLLIYGVASVTALFIDRFELLLLARMLAAFGAAVGSVGTQTMIRDTYRGTELARVFSVMGIALAASPAIGMVTGAALAHFGSYQGVFSGLTLLASILLGWSVFYLPETRSEQTKPAPIMAILAIMLKDKEIWRTAFLVALFNVNLFSYYQLAPFHFEQLNLSHNMLGYSGLLLTLGSGIGAGLNTLLLRKNKSSASLIFFAACISVIGSILVMVLSSSGLFVFPMVFIVIAYGIAIPNILASALSHYTHCLGTAGALLGLLYYWLLGIGLAMAGYIQNLGAVLLCCSVLITPLLINKSKIKP